MFCEAGVSKNLPCFANEKPPSHFVNGSNSILNIIFIRYLYLNRTDLPTATLLLVQIGPKRLQRFVNSCFHNEKSALRFVSGLNTILTFGLNRSKSDLNRY